MLECQLMISQLISGGDNQTRYQKALEIISLPINSPDFFIIDQKETITINQVREIRRWLALKPYQEKRQAVLVLEADQLTLPAQQAFLKTLEEPNENCLIVLTTGQINSLLPTIISRCQIINLPTNIDLSLINQPLINQLQNAGPGQRLLLAQNFRQPEEIKKLIEQLMISYRQLLVKQPDWGNLKKLHLLQKNYQIVNLNLNPQLFSGNLFLGL